MRIKQSDSDAIDAMRNNRYSVATLLTLTLRMTHKHIQHRRKTALQTTTSLQFFEKIAQSGFAVSSPINMIGELIFGINV